MNTLWTIGLGILGTGTLIYFGWVIFLIGFRPISLGNEEGKLPYYPTWRDKMRVAPVYAKMILLVIIICFSMYEVSYFLLGWMPDDWGRLNNGDWVTPRGNLSVLFGLIGGIFLAEGILKGVGGRIEAHKAWVQIYIRDKIYLAEDEQQLSKLRDDFERAKNKAREAIKPRPMSDYIDGIKPIELPPTTQWHLILEAIEKIDRRLEQLNCQGDLKTVDDEED